MQLLGSVAGHRRFFGSLRSNRVCRSAHPTNHDRPEERFWRRTIATGPVSAETRRAAHPRLPEDATTYDP
jgi:hypothetical protein